MTKGIPGIAIPSMTLFFGFITIGKHREFFKPINIIPGVLIFALITVPWHYTMFKLHGDAFFQEYIVKHHFARFFNSVNLGRKKPLCSEREETAVSLSYLAFVLFPH